MRAGSLAVRLLRRVRGRSTNPVTAGPPLSDLERAVADNDAPAVTAAVAALAKRVDPTDHSRIRDVVALLRNTNHADAAIRLLDIVLAREATALVAATRYRLQVRLGDTIGMSASEELIRATTSADDPLADVTVAAGLLRSGDPLGAEVLLTDRGTDSALVRRRLVEIAESVGDHEQVLALLPDHGRVRDTERLRRIDALAALGRLDEARTELDEMSTVHEDVLIRIAAMHDPGTADALALRIGQEADAVGTLSSPEEHGIALFRTNRADQAIRVLFAADGQGALSLSGRQALANALYSERRFEEAAAVLDGLAWTERHWSAMKLRGRILIQLGRFAEALENREAHSRPGDSTDQVRYHALLSLGRYSDAFRRHPFIDDMRRLRTTFPDNHERHPDDTVESRFVVADAGPGDEIQDASVYGELAERSSRLTATCDPRLATLLRRSFPTIEFVPTERWRPGGVRLGSHAPDVPKRARNALHYLLTEEADAIARSHDRVVLGRAVKNVRDLSAGPRPAEPFLVPDAGRVKAWSERLADAGPTIGLVWRSELQTSWRAVHYLRAVELQPFVDVPAHVACLQHDVTDDELDILHSLFGDRLVHLGDADLRNDFEEMAALVASLSLTVGIGTTIVNLAAAVGCPTLMMQPSHFGSWLATDDEGRDFWYRPCRVVVADPPYDTKQLVRMTAERAALTVREMTGAPD